MTGSGGPGRRRQEIAYRVTRAVLGPFFGWRFNLKTDPQPDFPAPYIVVSNHVTELDFLLLGVLFREPMGFVVGQGLLQSRLLRFLLVWLYGSIAKQKGTADARTTMGMMRRLKEGRNVCLFAEGNTTFDGRTDRIHEATGNLIRAVRAGLITCRIQGGYFSLPRWGRGIRRGQTSCRVVSTYDKEALESMDAEEINRLLIRDLCEDAYQEQRKDPIAYRGKRLAEGIEHALYLCPSCLMQGTLRGTGNEVRCSACGMRTRYTPYGSFEGDTPFPGICEWTDWQRGRIRDMLANEGVGAVVTDGPQRLLLQDADGRLRRHAFGEMGMGGDSLRIGAFETKLSDIAGLEIFRKNILQFTHRDGRRFQTEPSKGFCALKYRDLYRIIQENKR